MTQVYDNAPLSERTVAADAPALALQVAGWIVDAACAAPGRFALSLSGGSTPKLLFEQLAQGALAARMPWERVHLFWGDERMVPYDHPDSNYAMARAAMIDHVPIPAANVHPMPTDHAPAVAAQMYQAELAAYYGRDALDVARPLFDITLLGLGENGHTASLFPGTPALDETLAWVAPVTTGVPQPRLTLTYPALASSGTVAFLVAGAGKREVLRKVWSGDHSQPATLVRAIGQTRWFVDAAAAG